MTRKKIINYVLNNHVTSKAEIAKELNLSMPTVLANVNDLLEKKVLEETGEYASTGGRKAKSIGINKSYCHAMGILITANHIEMVLVNLGDEIIKKDRIRLKFTTELNLKIVEKPSPNTTRKLKFNYDNAIYDYTERSSTEPTVITTTMSTAYGHTKITDVDLSNVITINSRYKNASIAQLVRAPDC